MNQICLICRRDRKQICFGCMRVGTGFSLSFAFCSLDFFGGGQKTNDGKCLRRGGVRQVREMVSLSVLARITPRRHSPSGVKLWPPDEAEMKVE
jgi:hypothetical protein